MIMKTLFLVFFFSTFYYSYSQSIIVEDDYNATELVSLMLNNSCLDLLNTSMSNGQSVGYFNRNGSSFPLNEGVVIRNGLVTLTAGSYSNSNLSSPLNNNTDSFLQNLSNSSSGLSTSIKDVAFLEFDFKPAFNSFSFDFLFASNEYGEFQCLSNDIFAFVLTNLNTGVSTNLAVLPGSSIPVTVRNIRNAAYNSNCNSSNPGYFGVYNVDNPSNSSINMRGQTTILTAASDVIPNTPYRIRMVIADYGDSDYDSAVFIDTSSFTSTFDLGSDKEICSGDSYTLTTGIDTSYSHQWFFNDNPIPGATNPSYIVSQPGEYKVEIDKVDCHIEDTITFFNLSVNSPQNLYVCNNGASNYSFNLTQNNENSLSIDTSIYDLYYFNSLENISTNSYISSSQINNYISVGNETIYIKIFNTLTAQFCDAVYPFQLNVIQFSLPEDIEIKICESELNYSLAQLNSLFTIGIPSNVSTRYFTNETNAINNSNSIASITNSFSGTLTLWVRVSFSIGTTNCFEIVSFSFTIHPTPLVDEIEDVIECSEYELDTLVNGNYFTLSGGPTTPGQIPLYSGDIIDEEGTYYVFSGPDENGCTNESSFNVYLIDEYELQLDHCGTFRVPNAPYGIGNFYTAAGGPNGAGSLIQSGTQFENTTNASIIQPIYYYAEVDGVFCRDDLFEIYIHPLPEVDVLEDVIVCNSYTLEPLIHGNYYTGTNGTGTQLFAGSPINSSRRIYIYNQNTHTTSKGGTGNCSKQTSFFIHIIDPSIYTSVTGCGSYVLPSVPIGGYFDQPNGNGNSIPANTTITTSQNVYYYANTTESPNCTDNLFYQITIFPKPLVDELDSVVACGEYILPSLTHGSYYKLSGGPAVSGQVQYFPNQVVDLSGTSLNPGTFYIYAPENEFGCDNQSSFSVTVNPLPIVDAVIGRIECLPFSINTPINGTIYSAPNGPNGTGTIVTNNLVFEEDTTFYIYRKDPVTGCETDNPFTVYYNGVSLPIYRDVPVCEEENYTLPMLLHTPPEIFSNFSIGYFYESGGINPVPANTIFNTPNTTTRIYVYSVNEGRFGITCREEKSFDIIVSETPVLPSFNHLNGNYCGSFTLPTLPTGNYVINYYSNSGGNSQDIITATNFSIAPEDEPLTLDFWVFAHAINNINCYDETHFQVTIYPLLTFEMEDVYLCVDPISSEPLDGVMINSGLSSVEFNVNWYLNANLVGSGTSIFATELGTYTAVPSKLTFDIAPNCNYAPAMVEVLASSTAIASVEVSQPFDEVANALVTIENGFGSYLYQLDDGIFQSSPEFNNLNSGMHTIIVRDILGNCGDFILEFVVVKHPKFFTPNNDGYNDLWNIWDLKETQPNALISIFDRYGKLVTQITPISNGWNGTYNGNHLPSTDYWFTIEFINENKSQIFKSHFSMKR